MTIAEAGKALRTRSVSSAELTGECLAQIEKRNPELNAFITVTAEDALQRARRMDLELARGQDRGPLHGIPIAHKDLIWTKGVRTTCGSKLFEHFVPERDAAVAANLDRAGAVMVGKTGLHELAYGVTSDNPFFGAVRNPRDPGRIPGGSSGGSGAAVAAGMALMATGTDTGGSIRIPASYCGVVGLKPTYGLVDRSGVQPLGLSLDHAGPLTLTVGDAALALEAMGGPARPHPGGRASAVENLAGVRIGMPENFYFEQVDAEVRDAASRAAAKAERAGATLIAVRVPDIDALNLTGLIILLSEAAAVYERYLAERDRFGADVLALLDQGRLIPATAYVNAQRVRKQLTADFRRLFESIDCLFTPATPITAPRIGQNEVELDGETYNTRLLTTRFVRGVNVLGYPALAMPCGTSRAGLPIGLQTIARPFEEGALFRIGEALERS